MSLGDDLAAALPELRAQAESMMRDTCVITATVDGGWDGASGTYTEPSEATIYSGKCRLRMPRAAGTRVDSGAATWAVDDGVLSLPVDGSQAVTAGHVATVTLGSDPLTTVRATVQATHAQTDSTARRLPVKVVSRDA